MHNYGTLILACFLLLVGCGSNPQSDSKPRCGGGAACGSGLVCSTMGSCIVLGECLDHADCSAVQMCDDGACVPRLACDRPGGFCNEGFYCNSRGDCIAEDSCSDDADCDGQKCARSRGVCIAPDACFEFQDCTEPGTLCSDGACVPGSACGETKPAGASQQPVNLLIVLDRSCSMSRAKWNAAWGSFLDLLDDRRFQEGIRWGLAVFPDTTKGDLKCEQDEPVPVEVGENNWQELQAFLENVASDPTSTVSPLSGSGPCVTNIYKAMEQAAANPAIDDPTVSTHVLLVTDGKEYGCGNRNMLHALTRDEVIPGMLARGARTYVVGFDGGINKERLTELAEAGGTAIPLDQRAAPDEGFLLADPETLMNKLQDVVQSVLGCEFKIDEIDGRVPTPEELTPSNLNAFLVTNNDLANAQSLAHGTDWTISGDVVTLTGAACDAYVAADGQHREVLFTVACEVPE